MRQLYTNDVLFIVWRLIHLVWHACRCKASIFRWLQLFEMPGYSDSCVKVLHKMVLNYNLRAAWWSGAWRKTLGLSKWIVLNRPVSLTVYFLLKLVPGSPCIFLQSQINPLQRFSHFTLFTVLESHAITTHFHVFLWDSLWWKQCKEELN